MKIYNIVEAKTQLSKLIREALRGKNVLIGNRAQPLVKLSIYKPKKRKIGMYDGQGWISDDFNAPLDDFKEYE